MPTELVSNLTAEAMFTALRYFMAQKGTSSNTDGESDNFEEALGFYKLLASEQNLQSM
jgi:hypothetical protein